LSPGSIAHRSLLAERHFRAGEYHACRGLILDMQREGVDTPLARLGLAMLDFIDNRAEAAVEHLHVAQGMNVGSARVLELIGRLFLRLRKVTEGSQALDDAIAREPTLASAHVGRAIAYLLARDPAAAERKAREASRLDSNSSEAHYHLGLALSRQGRDEEAIEALKAAVTAAPQAAGPAHRRLVELFQRRGAAALAMHHNSLVQRSVKSARPAAFDLEWLKQGLAT
jgi:tetratricopeptide (TPR) repeat protein